MIGFNILVVLPFRYPREFSYLLYVEEKTGKSVATTRARIKLTDVERTRYISVPKRSPHKTARYVNYYNLLVNPATFMEFIF